MRSNAQTGSTWSTSEAVAAVEAVQFGGAGPTPFDAIDAYAETIPTLGALTTGTAAKNIVLGASPYGFDPSAFDPAGDGTPVDLVSLMGGCSATGGSTFNFTLYIVLAQSLVCGAPSAAALQAVRDAQQTNGGWNFNGDPTTSDIDPDTTALAIQALVAGGADATDPAVRAALGFFATNQQASGAWQSFGVDDPNSTSLSVLGITAAGYDVESSCWRDTADPSLAGTPYTSPTAWLRSQQLTTPPADAGRIVSPNDSFGVNTFATSQTVEALLQVVAPDRAGGRADLRDADRRAGEPAAGRGDAEVHRMTVGARARGVVLAVAFAAALLGSTTTARADVAAQGCSARAVVVVETERGTDLLRRRDQRARRAAAGGCQPRHLRVRRAGRGRVPAVRTRAIPLISRA